MLDKAPYPEVLRRADRRIAKVRQPHRILAPPRTSSPSRICIHRCHCSARTQYGGYVEGIASENVYGKTFCDSQEFQRHENKLNSATGPPVDPAWWAKEGSKMDAQQGKQMVGYGGFIPQIYAENIHGEDFAAAQRTAEIKKAAPAGEILEPDLNAAHRQTAGRAQEDHSEDKNVPGYGGYVPGIYAKGVFGATFEAAQKEAESLLAADEHPRAVQDFDKTAFDMLKQEERNTRPVMENKVKVSGYAGFIPNIGSRNLCGDNWEEAQLTAKSIDDGIMRSTAKVLIGDGPREALASHTTVKEVEKYVNPEKIPGYAGYVPKIYARNIFGQTFKNSQETSHVV